MAVNVMRLSIVTISFNQGRYLAECLASVIEQKTAQVELIVVDPGSTDGSRELLLSHRDMIDRLIFEPDNGPADGLNRGFAAATGTHGYFINSDDFMMPGGIVQLFQFWQDNPDADVGLCEAWLVNGDSQPLRRLRTSPVSPARILDGRSIIVQQGMSFSMDMFRRVGGFRVENRSCWDAELLYDFTLAGAHIAYGRKRIGAFRLHNDSLTGGIEGGRHQERLKQDWDRMSQRLPPEAGRRLPLQIARLAKHLHDPFFTLENLRMRFMAHQIRSRWIADLATKGADK